jgi:cytochrome c-type biogenesis protein CcmH
MRRLLLLALALVLGAAPAPAQEPAPGSPPTPGPQALVGPPRGAPVQGAELDARTEEVAALLRCPVCQGLSVADSPSPMAQKMRVLVRELVAAGYDRDQILNYFEGSYGEFVRLRPALRGVNWLVWLAPLGGLLAGGVVVTWALRRGRRAGPPPAAEPAEAPARDRLPEDAELARYVLKVREQAYGWPGGVPPREA